MKKRTTMKQWLLALSLMIAGSVMSAYATGRGGTDWKEEVLLHDGGKIIVDRTVNRHGRHEIGQRPPIGDQSISFTMPGTNQRVVWKDGFSEDVNGANFNLMMLEIVQDTPYVLATPAGCLSYNKWGRPNPPYVVFRYQGNEWKRIPLQELPAEIERPNMLQSSPDDVAKKNEIDSVVPVAVIQEERREYQQPEYKTILREALPNYGRRCGEMVYDGNGGWIGIGWFSEQPSKEACLKYCEHQKIGAQYCPCATLFKGK